MRFLPRKNRPALILLLAVLPFVVGFDISDSSGTYAKVSGGRGAYHLTGCHRDFDSEFLEGQVSMRHTFNTGTHDESASLWKKAGPEYTTLGYFADFVTQDLTIVKADSVSKSKAGDTETARGFAGGAYVGLDWKWVGVDLGLAALLLNLGVDDAERNKGAPMLGLRLGLMNGIYATGEVAGSNPFLSGGGHVNFGLGGKFHATRAWLGVGSYGLNGYKDFGSLGILKLDQGFGPWDLSLSVQGSGKDIPPANLGIDHESGFSLGLSYRLSSLD